MDKAFLRFNDYLGLSSILQTDDIHGETIGAEVQRSRPTSTSFFTAEELTRIDKRIEDIISQHTRRRAAERTLSPVVGAQSDTIWANSPIQRSSLATLSSEQLTQPTSPPFLTNRLLQTSCLQRAVPLTESAGISKTCISPPRSSLTLNSLSSSPISPAASDSLTHRFFPSSSIVPSPLLPINQPSATTQELPTNHGTAMPLFDTQMSLQRLFAQQRVTRKSGCSFCRNNKEVDEWVTSHQLKDSLNRVTCPVLRSYVCPLCFASGDNAHTLGHCPLNPDKRRSSVPLAVRRRTNATGKVKL